jgi:HEAT repeats
MRTCMKYRRVGLFIFAFVFVIAAIAFFLHACGKREPVYQGHTLTYWLEQPQTGHYDPAVIREANFAILQIGTNGIPCLLKMVRKTDLPLKGRLNGWLEKRKLNKFRTAMEDQMLAVSGFFALGAKGAPAIPELTKLLDDRDAGVRFAAVECLTVLAVNGKDSIKDAVPALIRHFNDADATVRFATVETVANMQPRPDLAIPQMTAELESNKMEPDDANVLIYAIGRYGTNARAAVNVLNKYATNSDATTRRYAVEALSLITNATPNPY